MSGKITDLVYYGMSQIKSDV